MARQPTIQLGVSPLVTVDAKSHLEFHGNQAIPFLYIPMAYRTIDVFLDVPLVIELNVIRHIKNPNPGDRIFLLIVQLQLPDLWMLGNDVFMAEQALPHRRNAGLSGSLHKGVAEPTTDSLDPCMDPVAEIYRLLWADGSMGINIK